MFKLVSLTSETNLFNPVIFKDGLNIILGKYSNSDKDINGIGKSTIVKLVDYCLLADGPKKTFFSEKYKFLKNHSVTLRFSVANIPYCIQRDFTSKKIALFSKDNEQLIEYEDAELRIILFKIISDADDYTGVFDLGWYRTIMNFFIQDDHAFHARTSEEVMRFIEGSKRKSELLFLNMFLLGIDNTNTWKFDESQVELKQFRSDQTRIRKQITESSNKSVDSFRAEVESIERKIEGFEKSLDEFDFDSSYSFAEDEIKTISADVSKLNKEHLALSSKLRDIKESLEINVDIDITKVRELYGEINLQFSDFIKKELDEVLRFRKNITANRSIFLNKREGEYSKKLKDIRDKVLILEARRSELFKRLDEKNAFDSIKSAYKTLLEEKNSLDSKSSFLTQLDDVELSIANQRTEVTKCVAEIVKEKSNLSTSLEKPKEIFLDIVENSVDTKDTETEAHLNIEPRSHATSPFKFSIEVPRSESLGKGRFKIVAYDLTVFFNSCISNRSLPRFLIHDGVFHGISHKTRINLINYLNKKLKMIGDIQYIITLNEDEVIFPDEGETSTSLDFDLENMAIIKLEDDPNNMFFGKEFG